MAKHYYVLQPWIKNPGSKAWKNSILPEMASVPVMNGAQLAYFWPELEPVKDEYNFNDIIARINDCKAIGKTFSIKFYLRSFDLSDSTVPDYVKLEPTAEGGQFQFTSQNPNGPTEGGYNINLWNTYVRQRLAALADALGAALNQNEGFEYITLTETAYGDPIVPLTQPQIDGFYEGRLLFTGALRTALPNKIIRNLCNYTRDSIKTYIPAAAALGSSIGWPNTMQDEPGLWTEGATPGVYTYVTDLKSQGVHIGADVQEPDYEYSRMDKGEVGFAPTIEQLHTLAETTLKADAIFWTRSGTINPATSKTYFKDLINYLK